MPQELSKNFGVAMATEYVRDAVDNRANTFLIIARVEAWANDASPNTPYDNIQSAVGMWRSAIGGKRVTGNDMVTATRRIDWANNTPYAAFSDKSVNLYGNTNNFYAMTDDFNVYKCLANNNGSNSTVKPSYTSYDRVNKESDGYIWKYMLTLSTADRVRFLTDDFMPVRTLASNDGSLQWLVQQAAVDGAINVIDINNAGTGYTNSSNIVVTITGDGTLANATASLNTSTNVVSNITVTNQGTGYHYANAAITGGAGANATANVVISAFGGHGFQPAYELGASNVIINIRLKGTEDGKLVIGNDYRQISLIIDPVRYGTANTIFSNTVFDQTRTIQTSTGATAYTLDELVYQGTSLSAATFSGRVVDWDNTNNVVSLTETNGTPTTAALYGVTSTTNRFLISTTNPELEPFTGKQLYIENITSVMRAEDQTEDIKLVVQF